MMAVTLFSLKSRETSDNTLLHPNEMDNESTLILSFSRYSRFETASFERTIAKIIHIHLSYDEQEQNLLYADDL